MMRMNSSRACSDRRRRRVLRFFWAWVALPSALAVPVVSRAASASWIGAGADDLWANTSNWSASPVPGTGDAATFNSAAGAGASGISINGITVRTIAFDTSGTASYKLGTGTAGSETFTLGDGANAGAITLNSGVLQNQLINAAITLGDTRVAATYTFANESVRSLKLAGNLAGNNLTGTAGLKTVAVSGAGEITLEGNIALGGASDLRLSKSGSGVLNLGGASLGGSGSAALYTLGLIDRGVVNLGAGSVLYLDAGNLDSITSRVGGVISGGTINWGNAASVINSIAGSLTINSVIAGAGPVFRGSGLTILNGTNTFTDAPTISYGSAVQVSSIGNGGSPSPLGVNTTIKLSENNIAPGLLKYVGAGETSSRIINLNGINSVSSSIIDQSGTGLLKFTSDFTANPSATPGTAFQTLVLQGSTSGEGEIAGAIVDYTASFETALNKAGSGKWKLSGNNTFTGKTTLDAGTLTLDYGVNNSSKLSSTAANGALNLNGGVLELSGGSHTETVLSTTVNQGTTYIKQIGGTSKLSMGAITFTAGAVDFSAANIATTTTGNDATRGFLNLRATVAATDFARNDGANNIVAFASYSDFNVTPRNGNNVYALAGSGTYSTFLNMSGTGLKITTTGAGQSLTASQSLFMGAVLFAGAHNYTIATTGASGQFRPTRLLHYGAGTLTVGALGDTDLNQYGTGKTILTANAVGDKIVSVYGGTIQFSGNLQLGTGASAKTINLNNGTLVADTAGGSFALDNSGANPRSFSIGAGGGTLDVIGGNSLTVSGVISGSGPLTFGGASSSGTIVLNGANTATGDTTIRGGTVQLGASGSFANTVNITVSGGTLNLGGKTQNFAGWYGPSLQGGSIANGTLDSLSDYDVRSGSISAVLSGGAGLVKTTTGTVTLSGANTYTGATTVSEGTLALSGSGSIAGRSIVVGGGATLDVGALASDFSLGSGQTLSGSGTVSGDLVIGSEGALSPGLPALPLPSTVPGTLSNTAGTVTYAGGGHYEWELNSTAGSQGASPGWDHHYISGALAISATAGNPFHIDLAGLTADNELGLVSGWNPLVDHTWTIATASGGITGFSADKFAVDSSVFAAYNSIGSGTFTVQVSGNDLQLKFNRSTEAVSSYWGLAGAGDWSTSASAWIYSQQGVGSRVAWNNGDNAVFSAAGNGTGTFDVNVGTVSANSITVSQGAPTFTNGTITLGEQGLANAGLLALSVPATINSVLAGTNGITKSGAATLTLGGAATFTGPTTISEGTLQLGGGAAAGSLNPASAISNNSVLSFNRSDTVTQGTDFGAIGGTGVVTKVGANTLVLNGANTYSGGTVLNRGSISVGHNSALGAAAGSLTMGTNTTLTLNGHTVAVGNLSLSSTGSVTVLGGTLQVSGDISIGSGTNLASLGTVNLTGSGQTISLTGVTATVAGDLNIGSSSNNLVYSASSTVGVSQNMNLTGSGNINATSLTAPPNYQVTLGGNNPGWTGDLYINSGTVQIGTPTSISAANTVYFTGVGPYAARLVVDTATIGGLQGTSGTVLRQFSGSGTLTIDTGGSSYSFGGDIVAAFGNVAIAKAGAGTQTLSGNNTYNAPTTISGGKILLSGSGTLGASGAALTLSGGTLDLGGSSQTKGNLSITAAAASGNTLENGTITATNFLANFSSGTAVVTANLNGDAALSKQGAGTLVLSGANTYGGLSTLGVGTVVVHSVNSVSVPAPAGSSSLGVPSSAANGILSIGAGGSSATLVYTGTVSETSDRTINLAGSSGGATIDQSGAAALKFAGDVTATGDGNKTLTLTGSASGTGEIAGGIPNHAGRVTLLSKTGTGTWTLSGTNTYSGSTTISGGTLALSGEGAIGSSTSITISAGASLSSAGRTDGTLALGSGQVLSGPGSIAGHLANAAGSVAPGSGLGTLSITGDFSQGASGVLNIEVSGSSSFDALRVTGSGSLGGTLNVTNLGGSYAIGSVLTVATFAARSGAFAATNLPSLTGGLALTVSYAADKVLLTVSGSGPTYWWNGDGLADLGGGGNWSTTDVNWHSPASNDLLFAWSNGTPSTSEAIFAGDAGTVTNTQGALNFNRVTFRAGGFVITNGTLNFSGASPSAIALSNGVTATIASGLTGTNAIWVNAPDATLVLGGTNNYRGTLTLSNGAIRIASASALGSAVGSSILNDGSLLDLNGLSVAEPIIYSGGATITNSGAGAAALTADATVNSSFTIGVGAGSISVGRLIHSGTSRTVTKTGSGTLTFNGGGANSLVALALNGGTVVCANASGCAIDRGATISSGLLRLSGANTDLISDAQPFTINGGLFELNGKSETIASIGGAGGAVTNSSATAATLTVGAGDSSASYDGIISGTNLSFVKSGSGSQTLTGNNIYGGATTVSGGRLALSGGGAISNSPSISISAGAMLSVTGRADATLTLLPGQRLAGAGSVVGHVTNANGSVAPGTGVGTLSVTGDYVQGASGILNLDLAGSASYDQLRVSGSGALGGTLNVTNGGGAYQVGAVLTVATFGARSGTFATTNLPVLSGGQWLTVSYTADQVLLTVDGSGPTYWWNGDGLAGLGGSGNWSSADLNWHSPSSNDQRYVWYNESPSGSEAIFAGDPGTVANTEGALHFSRLTFRADGFIITNGTLDLSGVSPNAIVMSNGVTATIESGLTGTNDLWVGNAGATLVLGGTNNFSGTLTLSNGAIRLASATALGAASGGTVLSAGALLDLNGRTIAEPITYSGNAVISNSSASAAAITANATVNSSFTIGVGAGDVTIGRLIHVGSSRTVTKTGSGTLTLNGSGNNSLMGLILNEGTVVFANPTGFSTDRGTTINDGTLRLSGSNADFINDSQPFTLNGGIFDLSGKSETIAAVDGAGGVITNTSGTTGTLTLGGGNTTAHYSGNVQGKLSLAKTGSGSQTLSGTVAYSGNTTVSGGKLAFVGANASLGTGASLSVSAGATLSVTGTTTKTVAVDIGQTLSGAGTVQGSVTNAGQVTPGATVGTLTVSGDYAQESSGTLGIQLALNNSYDVLSVAGTARLGGTLTISTNAGLTITAGDVYTVVVAAAVSGTFATTNLPDPAANWTVSYTGDKVLVSPACGGLTYAPALSVSSARTGTNGHSLSFSAWASNPGCSAPVSIIATGLPGNATFALTGSSALAITGSFSWASAVAGTYPVRFIASNGGSYETSRVVMVYVNNGSEANNGSGVPASQTNWAVSITNIQISSSANATVVWAAVDGVAYDIYRTDQGFGAAQSWTKVTNTVAGATLEDEMVAASSTQRFFQVVPAGSTPTSNGVWGVIKPTIPAGFSMFAPPLVSDRKWDGQMGTNLAAALSGSDQVYVLNGGTWTILHMDNGVWKDELNAAYTTALNPGQGVYIKRSSGTAQPSFAGPVGNTQISTNVIAEGWNIIGYSEGKNLSVSTMFQSPISGTPEGNYDETLADQIVIQNANGTWRRLIRLPNGTWYDYATGGSTTLTIKPGQAYYYYRQSGEGEMTVRF